MLEACLLVVAAKKEEMIAQMQTELRRLAGKKAASEMLARNPTKESTRQSEYMISLHNLQIVAFDHPASTSLHFLFLFLFHYHFHFHFNRQFHFLFFHFNRQPKFYL